MIRLQRAFFMIFIAIFVVVMKSYKHILLFIAMAAVAIAIGAIEQPEISEEYRSTLSRNDANSDFGSSQYTTYDNIIDFSLYGIRSGNTLRTSFKRSAQRTTNSSRWITLGNIKTSRKYSYDILTNLDTRDMPNTTGIKSRAEIVIRMRKLII